MGEEGESVRLPSFEYGIGVLNARSSCRVEDLQLTRFKGRPGELSPKARFWLFAGWLLPSRFKYVSSVPFLFAHRL